MTVNELDKMALAGGDMPTGLNMAYQAYYIAVRSLYSSYNDGQITKEQATREKGLIYEQLKVEIGTLKMYEKISIIYGECVKLQHKPKATKEEYRKIFEVIESEL